MNNKFPEGIRVFKPNNNAPDFIKADLVIDRGALISYLAGSQEKEIRLSIKESREGKWYVAINDYKGGRKPSSSGQGDTDDLPF